MSVPYYGDFAEDDTVNIPFNTFTSDDPSASCTITNLVDADLKVHKDGSTDEIVTDGATIVIDFDGITGNHLVTIDTSVHADYSTGSEYAVRMEGTTVDGATINAWVGAFSIERAGGVIALLKLIQAAVITNAAGADIAADILTVDNLVDDLETRLTATRAGYLDELAPANLPADVDAILADTGTDGVVVAAASKTGYALSNAGADAIWDRQESTLSVSFETLMYRIFTLASHKINVTDADGVAALRNAADSANIATGSITDNDTTTVRAKWSWV